MPQQDKLLIVRHGRGRGRIAGYGDELLDYLRAERTDTARRVVIHETGTPGPALDGIGAVLFWLADPLADLYPDCHAEALRIAEEATDHGARIVNPPASLARYSKSRQAEAWLEAGLPAPSCRRYADYGEFQRAREEIGAPFLVRADVGYGQHGAVLARSERQSATVGESDLVYPGVVSAFTDTRASYRERNPGSLLARFYHKKRLYLWGDELVPDSLVLSPHPIVGLEGSVFQRFRMQQRRLRKVRPRLLRRAIIRVAAARARVTEAIRLDREMWLSPAEQPDVFREAADVLGLGFAAFDYATHADGSVILWEANPYPFMTEPRKCVLHRERGLASRWVIHTNAFERFVLSLLSPRQASADLSRQAAVT